jgi:hypothetical protein
MPCEKECYEYIYVTYLMKQCLEATLKLALKKKILRNFGVYINYLGASKIAMDYHLKVFILTI